MRKTLTIIALSLSQTVFAKDGLSSSDTSGGLNFVAPYQTVSTWKPFSLSNAAPYSGGAGSSVHFEVGVQLGYFVPTLTSKQDSVKAGGGFMFKVDLGVGIEMGGSSYDGDKTGLLSITAFYSIFGTSVKTKDAVGNAQSDKRSITTLGVPISYGKVSTGKRGGFYWQVGATIADVNDVSDGGQTYNKEYNRIYIEPFASFGLSAPFVMKQHRQEVASGRVLFGPFVSYVVNNMMQESGVTMHGYTVGISYKYVFGME